MLNHKACEYLLYTAKECRLVALPKPQAVRLSV